MLELEQITEEEEAELHSFVKEDDTEEEAELSINRLAPIYENQRLNQNDKSVPQKQNIGQTQCDITKKPRVRRKLSI